MVGGAMLLAALLHLQDPNATFTEDLAAAQAKSRVNHKALLLVFYKDG